MENYPKSLRHDSGVSMSLDTSRLLLAFKSDSTDSQSLMDDGNINKFDTQLADSGLRLADTQIKTNGRSKTTQTNLNYANKMVWVNSNDEWPIDEKRLIALNKKLKKELKWIAPVYRIAGVPGLEGLVSPFPDVLIIKPQYGLGQDGGKKIVQALSRYGLKEVQEKSRYLNDALYFKIENPETQSAYELQSVILQNERQLVRDVILETVPLLSPFVAIPDDALFPQQWNMTQIQAPEGWDISTGTNTVIACVIDSGCDLTHPDIVYASPGVDLGDMISDGSPNNHGGQTGHGTCCAGIVAATFNNSLGVAGVAGNCRIISAAIRTFSNAEIAAGINYATANGAQVVSMSFRVPASGLIDTAITNAIASGLVLCAATGNGNSSSINYPARHPQVMACGASDQADNRKSPASPDGEGWGSDYGNTVYNGVTTGVSVVAPGVRIPTTDIQGNGGYNPAAGAAGNFFLTFNGTSSATPHVAGLVALLRSQYPLLTNIQVRNIIELTAQKVGVVPYVEDANFPNGARNEELGYGRINVFRALDFANVMIKDYGSDSGLEPSTPPGNNFWTYSDIALRPTDDDVFLPEDYMQSGNVEKGQSNYLYVRITNNGPREARNVIVNARATAYAGTEFVYPQDWTQVNSTHIQPSPVLTSFATIPSGESRIAKFRFSKEQVDELFAWTAVSWHPCLLAEVASDNDYAFNAPSGGNAVLRRNNFAQKNLSIIDVEPDMLATFSFIAGNKISRINKASIIVEKVFMPEDAIVRLNLNYNEKAFPHIEFGKKVIEGIRANNIMEERGITFLEKTQVETSLFGGRGVVTLEKGSLIAYPKESNIGKVRVDGGRLIRKGDKRLVEIVKSKAIIDIAKTPKQLIPLTLTAKIPSTAKIGEQYMVSIKQQNERGDVIGGVTAVFVVKK